MSGRVFAESRAQVILQSRVGSRATYLAVYDGQVLGTIELTGSLMRAGWHPVSQGAIKGEQDMQKVDSVAEAFQHLFTLHKLPGA